MINTNKSGFYNLLPPENTEFLLFGASLEAWKTICACFCENEKLVGNKWLRRIFSLISRGQAGHRVYPMPWELGRRNIQFCRIWSEISTQIVFQVADSTKVGPLAVSDGHLVLCHLYNENTWTNTNTKANANTNTNTGGELFVVFLWIGSSYGWFICIVL